MFFQTIYGALHIFCVLIHSFIHCNLMEKSIFFYPFVFHERKSVKFGMP